MSLVDVLGKIQSVVTEFITGNEKTENSEESNSIFSFGQTNQQQDVDELSSSYYYLAQHIEEQNFIQREISRNSEHASKFDEMMQQELQMANLPDPLKKELAPLFKELATPIDEDERDRLEAKIEEVCEFANSENPLPENTAQEILRLEILALQSAEGSHVASLYNQLSNIESSSGEDFSMYAEIEKTQSEYDKRLSELNIRLELSYSNFSPEQKSELGLAFFEYMEADSEIKKEDIENQIQMYCAEQGIDEQSPVMLALWSEAITGNLDAQTVDLNKLLKHIDSDEIKEVIIAEKNKILDEAQFKLSGISMKQWAHHMNLPEDVKGEVFELINSLQAIENSDAKELVKDRITMLLGTAGVDFEGIAYKNFSNAASIFK